MRARTPGMKLTRLGKALIALIGLGLIAVAVYRYGPDSLTKWHRATDGSAPVGASAPSPGQTTVPSTKSPGPAGGRRTAENRWIRIPAGGFLSGENRTPVTQGAFEIEEREVTNRDYQSFLNACAVGSDCGPRELPPYWEDADYLDTHLDHPVVAVSWTDADRYAHWANARLPTAQEWERAARGSDGREYPWGDESDPSRPNILGSNHDAKAKAPRQIATWPVTDPRLAKDASADGLLGMAGNVSEWTSTSSENEPGLMIVAGGSFDSWDQTDARTWHRVPKRPSDRSSSVGIRLARDIH
jgi:formylglycine-generating enzyme required for sulfatase activity